VGEEGMENMCIKRSGFGDLRLNWELIHTVIQFLMWASVHSDPSQKFTSMLGREGYGNHVIWKA
jgi:hypothetical protein